jgi:hypothetical protein
MRKSAKCFYTIGVNTKFKKKYLHPEDALKEVERINSIPNAIKKMIAYKCTTCSFFHIGRSTEDIKNNGLWEQVIAIPKQIVIEAFKPIVLHDDFDWETDKRII